jgi:hypothetical protein
LSVRSPAAALDLVDRLEALVDKLDVRAFDGPTEEIEGGPLVQSWPLYPLPA